MKEDKLKPSPANASEGKEEEKPKNEVYEAEKQLTEYQKLKDEYLNGWKRERADFLNYKKEEMERIGEFIKYANEELILKMLPILDNFEVASKGIPENLKNDNNIKGFLQIKQQIKNFLKTQGIGEIKTVGEKFDPNFHEIVGEVGPSEALAKEAESDIVVEEIKKGYTLHGKVIRPAKVKIIK